MVWVDYAILGILGISMVISLFRGYVREMLSIVAWAAAFWIAFGFSPQLSGHLRDYISVPSARLVVSFLILFFATLFVGGLINFIAAQLIEKTGLSGTDRIMGLVFGFLRGIAVVLILVLLAGLTPVPQDPWWRESQFLGHFQQLALVVRGYLPEEVSKYISYPRSSI